MSSSESAIPFNVKCFCHLLFDAGFRIKIFDFALSANPKISEIKKQAFCLLFVVLYDRGIIFSPENGDIFQ